MRRRTVRPFGSSIPASRAFSMLIGLAILWAVYDAVRQPANWNWLSANEDAPVAQLSTADGPATPGVPPPFAEILVPGPNDLDPAAVAEFHALDELITDKSALRPREMIAYWKLLAWSHAQPFAELEQRARKEPALTQIWEQPNKYRGQPIRLRLHVRRVLEWDTDPSKNALGASHVYEAMGWTDESKSLPYTIVFTEKPPEFPVGNDVEVDAVFVGYFLKIMTYTASDDTRRGTPLMMGRIRVAGRPVPKAVGANPIQIGGIVLGIGLLFGLVVWFLPRRKRPQRGTVFASSAINPEWVPLDESPTPAASETSSSPWESPHRPEVSQE